MQDELFKAPHRACISESGSQGNISVICSVWYPMSPLRTVVPHNSFIDWECWYSSCIDSSPNVAGSFPLNETGSPIHRIGTCLMSMTFLPASSERAGSSAGGVDSTTGHFGILSYATLTVVHAGTS
ncbi:hypothetical protein BHE74_00033635 [Ensete ventricosum]|nr:hypothetical protein BHE74_00033635 [Ensete ventricosum]